MTNKTYRSPEAARIAAIQRYKDKRGDTYRSHEERRRARTALQVRKASDRLAKDVLSESEAAYGVRECSSCTAALPLDATHYRPSKTSRHGLNTKCRACLTGYASWDAREAAQRARKVATAARRLAEQTAREERQRISEIKRSEAYREAMRMKHKANEMLRFYAELINATERTIEHGRSNEWLGQMILEIATDHARCGFLELNSPAYRAILRADYTQLDAVIMRDAWLRCAERWNDKRADAELTVSELLGDA